MKKRAGRNKLIDPRARDVLEYWRGRTGRVYQRYVYFIQEADDGPIKIGVAINPVKRLTEIQCGNPRLLRIAAVLLDDEDSESILHKHWQQAGIQGEWFGRGHQAAILASAERIAAAQIAAHEAGESPRDAGLFIEAMFDHGEVVA